MIIDIETTEEGWKITASGVQSPHPYTATLRRCPYHEGLGKPTKYCDGKHETHLLKMVRELRKLYEPGERLFR